MKYVKMLGLLAVAAAALMAFAGTASATTVTSPAGTLYTSNIAATAGATELVGSFTTVKCSSSSVSGSVKTHGAGVTAEGPISALSFSGCNFPVTVKKEGTLIAHATSGGNGTLTSSGAEVIVHTSVGECVFTTSSTDIGTLKGGTPAKLEIASAAINRTGGSFLCGSTAKWSGTYTVNTPGSLFLD
jgi:hypothetical protein